jgi:hypothetical protein
MSFKFYEICLYKGKKVRFLRLSKRISSDTCMIMGENGEPKRVKVNELIKIEK